MILAVFRRNSDQTTIAALYGAIVAQARLPLFYTAYGVADTVDGRFELIVLHLVLVLQRLGRAAAAKGERGGRNLGQRLFDMFCGDLDANLREMGVGDLKVPKEMRRLGEAFYGRQAAYLAALAALGAAELEKALARNIFGSDGGDGRAARLARYTRAAAAQLDAEEEAVLAGGTANFPDPEVFAHA
jgi:cytochrome b pre-mRNA-processing protein 3